MFRPTVGFFSPPTKLTTMVKPNYQHIINPPASRTAQPVAEPKLNYVTTHPTKSAEDSFTAKEQAYLEALDSHYEPTTKTP